MYNQDLGLNNLKGFICHKTQPTGWWKLNGIISV